MTTSPRLLKPTTGKATSTMRREHLVTAGTNGASDGLVTVDKANFAPRLGFAWSPTANANTVIRGAYGIFFSGQEIRTAAPLQLAYNLPFFYEPLFINGTTPAFTVSQGFPTLDPSQAVDPGVTSVDSRLRTPYYQSWNFAVQHGLPGSISLEVAYAGSKGTHLQGVTDPNQVQVPGPGDVQPRRPLPQFGGFTAITNIANSTYHSLQVKAEKHASHGLYFLSSFTYSKAINDLPEICCAAPFAQDNYNLAAERGRADFDQKLRWVLSFDYEIPFGGSHSHLDNRALDLVLGGWHVGGIYTLASGFPFSAYQNDDPSNTGTQGIPRPDQLMTAICRGTSALPLAGSTSAHFLCCRMMPSPSATRDETHSWARVKMSSIGRCARSLL